MSASNLDEELDDGYFPNCGCGAPSTCMIAYCADHDPTPDPAAPFVDYPRQLAFERSRADAAETALAKACAAYLARVRPDRKFGPAMVGAFNYASEPDALPDAILGLYARAEKAEADFASQCQELDATIDARNSLLRTAQDLHKVSDGYHVELDQALAREEALVEVLRQIRAISSNRALFVAMGPRGWIAAERLADQTIKAHESRKP
jgi:hypothetical protein